MTQRMNDPDMGTTRPSPAAQASQAAPTARSLHGVRVLDLSQGIAGPMAARLLGDFGAEVIKVEPPEGDPARALPPFVEDGPLAERSLLFAYLNWNKRGVALDLQTAQGRQRIEALVRASDIVIESFKPGTLEA
ncbi:MAG: hypothetical protein JWQ11_3771, partial [Rhizobacter sp.]|nr:hypothetical protein [Rhizobacter sp.]